MRLAGREREKEKGLVGAVREGRGWREEGVEGREGGKRE